MEFIMIKFNGENILVTGASDGLGKAICLLLNSLGANVIGIARNESKLEQLKKEIESILNNEKQKSEGEITKLTEKITYTQEDLNKVREWN